MSENTVYYTEQHEWVRLEDDGVCTVGITAFAQEQLGDVVFWQGPEVGDSFEKGDAVGEVESVKAMSDVYAPIAGTVVAVNEALDDEPQLVNEDPMGEGWMFRLQVAQDSSVFEGLLDDAAYRALLAAQ